MHTKAEQIRETHEHLAKLTVFLATEGTPKQPLKRCEAKLRRQRAGKMSRGPARMMEETSPVLTCIERPARMMEGTSPVLTCIERY